MLITIPITIPITVTVIIPTIIVVICWVGLYAQLVALDQQPVPIGVVGPDQPVRVHSKHSELDGPVLLDHEHVVGQWEHTIIQYQ